MGAQLIPCMVVPMIPYCIICPSRLEFCRLRPLVSMRLMNMNQSQPFFLSLAGGGELLMEWMIEGGEMRGFNGGFRESMGCYWWG